MGVKYWIFVAIAVVVAAFTGSFVYDATGSFIACAAWGFFLGSAAVALDVLTD